ncbi:hypothetical protein JXB22_08800 [candidate division WOR-3 bacterium]|nr:hypothetical protein [candidate division WOR-3 bacterium]
MMLLMIVHLTLPGVMNQGDRVLCHDARSCALGNAMLVLEHSPNPSAMGLLEDMSVSISGAIISANEKRGLRVYDSYGNNIGISTITNTTFTNVLPCACTFVFPLQFIRTGFQFAPVRDYTYSFHREYRDDFYQVTKVVDQEYSGRTYAISPMIAVTHSWLNIGVAQRFMYGRREFREMIIFPDAPDSAVTDEHDLNGMNTRCGVLIAPDMHFRVSYMYAFAYVLECDDPLQHDSFPAQHNLGFMYQPPGRIPTRFFGEVACETYDDPVFVYKIGVEHTLQTSYALRYGFCLYPDHVQPAVWTTVLTVGCGIHQPHFSADMGYAYGKRDYTSANYNGLGETENLVFDESLNTFLLSFTVHL